MVRPNPCRMPHPFAFLMGTEFAVDFIGSTRPHVVKWTKDFRQTGPLHNLRKHRSQILSRITITVDYEFPAFIIRHEIEGVQFLSQFGKQRDPTPLFPFIITPIRSTRSRLHFAPVCFNLAPIRFLHAPSTCPLPIERPSASRSR